MILTHDLTMHDKIAKSDSEHAHQAAFFSWVNSARLGGFPFACGQEEREIDPARPVLPELEWFHAIPNGGSRNKAEAARLKAEGVTPGVADTFLPVPKPCVHEVGRCYFGLYVEFKAPSRRNHKYGGLSRQQREFGDAVFSHGYHFCVAYSWRDAANKLMSYYGIDLRLELR